MPVDVKALQMTEADLLGYSVDDLKCRQCAGAFCSLKAGRVLDGKALIMCSRKPETREVLARLKPRR